MLSFETPASGSASALVLPTYIHTIPTNLCTYMPYPPAEVHQAQSTEPSAHATMIPRFHVYFLGYRKQDSYSSTVLL